MNKGMNEQLTRFVYFIAFLGSDINKGPAKDVPVVLKAPICYIS